MILSYLKKGRIIFVLCLPALVLESQAVPPSSANLFDIELLPGINLAARIQSVQIE
jgi:hypothetical protein